MLVLVILVRVSESTDVHIESTTPEPDILDVPLNGSVTGRFRSVDTFSTTTTCRNLGKALFRPVRYSNLFESVRWKSIKPGIERSDCGCPAHTDLHCFSDWNHWKMDRITRNTYLNKCSQFRHELLYSVIPEQGQRPRNVCVLLGRATNQVRSKFSMRKLSTPERVPVATIIHFSDNRNERRAKTAGINLMSKSILHRNQQSWEHIFSSPIIFSQRKMVIEKGGGRTSSVVYTIIMNFRDRYFSEYV